MPAASVRTRARDKARLIDFILLFRVVRTGGPRARGRRQPRLRIRHRPAAGQGRLRRKRKKRRPRAAPGTARMACGHIIAIVPPAGRVVKRAGGTQILDFLKKGRSSAVQLFQSGVSDAAVGEQIVPLQRKCSWCRGSRSRPAHGLHRPQCAAGPRRGPSSSAPARTGPG